jgi:protein-tyrosine-phosphatase
MPAATGLIVLLPAVLGIAFDEAKSRKDAALGTVVFVCEHGSVKSLIASEWFNRLASARGLRVRAVARGVTPDASVPPVVAVELRRDGFDVGGFAPRAVTPADRATAARVVAIGVEASSLEVPTGVPAETWNGIPPASESYAETRDTLKARVESLLDRIAPQNPLR